MSLAVVSLPFVSVADPATRDEGALDPLGLATVSDRLADWVLPGVTARMSRPRFLTAVAVSAALCEGLDDRPPGDGVTPAATVFEWLVVEGFARRAQRPDVRQTPGIEKVSAAVKADMRMSARAYLKTPSVFGFHGVYKRLAQHLGLVDDELRLNENGFHLLRVWEREQAIDGFADGKGSVFRSWRDAVVDAYEKGYSTRSAGWQGWEQFAVHLSPSHIGQREAESLWQLLLDGSGDRRGEVFELVDNPESRTVMADSLSDLDSVLCLSPRSSPELAARWRVIQAFESFGGCLEDGFEWMQFLSTRAGTQPLSPTDFMDEPRVRQLTEQLPALHRNAVKLLADAPGQIPDMFARIASGFEFIADARELFEALLQRHGSVQKAKPPEGKREWFERASDDRVMVRLPYRRGEPPLDIPFWRRTYRLRTAVLSFCNDLRR